MTTLAIKRLDSLPSVHSGNSRPTSPLTSTGAAAAAAVSKVSSPASARLSSPARNSLRSGGLAADKSPPPPPVGHEIPINIVKSPSYNQQHQHMESAAVATITSSPESRSRSSSQNNNASSAKSPTISASTLSNRTAAAAASSPTRQQTAPVSAQRGGADADSVNWTHLGGDDNNTALANTDTLRFNKYGFVQPPDTTTATLLRTTATTPLNKSSASVNHNKNNSSNLNTSTSSSDHNHQQQQAAAAAAAASAAAALEQQAATNLKDYLQNVDVEQFSEHIPIRVIQTRELKWVEMLNHFDEWMGKRFKKVKSRCRKGIPQSMRSKAWMHLTGAFLLKKQRPGYYQECLANPRRVDVARYIEDIKKDLHRQFPSHEMFMRREGRQLLYNILAAYAVHNREVGYCQAQGPIAALLLMHMPEEDAFWVLVRVSDFYLREYFKPGLEKVQIDGHALFYLFKRENRAAHTLMREQGIDPILYMTEWFMCVFARTLPWCTVLRVWDMFFCEGIKAVYRVALHLMRAAFADRTLVQRCQQQGMYETLNALKNLPLGALGEHALVRDSSLIRVGQEDLTRAFDKSKLEFDKQKREQAASRNQAPPVSSYVNSKSKSAASSRAAAAANSKNSN